ncbi:hypothetical protein [Senegalia sp. (in: firmicutes)]|uniref:hypothetical protein n=1 Tax=Senegalia sp. (in: firmicutes) TaxID=1924098 RepID=UPI003F955F9E
MNYNNTVLPSKQILYILSYKSSLKKSIKQLSLRKVDINFIIQDIIEYNRFIRSKDEFLYLKNKRLKSIQSSLLKYNKYINGKGCKVSHCFNDILDIRVFLEEYPNTFPEYFRVVDMREGKKDDDGYRDIHLYYQKDAYHYPIEVQLWCGSDIKFNIWSHTSVYKYVPQEVGLKLRKLYDMGKIKTQIQFENKLKEMMERR